MEGDLSMHIIGDMRFLSDTDKMWGPVQVKATLIALIALLKWLKSFTLWISSQDHAPGLCSSQREGSGSESLRWPARLRRRATRLCPSAQEQEGGGILLDPYRPGVVDV